MLGVVKVVPVPKLAPPVKTVYQFIVPDDPVAPSITVPLPQRLPGVLVAIVGTRLTVAVIAVLVPVVQPFAVAST